MSGKPYANRKPVVRLDLYHTPESLTEILLKKEKFQHLIEEPACGDNSIVDPIGKHRVFSSDITTGNDFLEVEGRKRDRDCITNPPFFLWDDFVNQAKKLQYKKTAFIGRTNYFGTKSRYDSDLFRGCKNIYVFNRYVDYQTPRRKDGLFHVGAMCTAWFVWERRYRGYPTIQQVDVNPWAKLGAYNQDYYKILEHMGIESTWTPDMEIDSVSSTMRNLELELEFRYTIKQLQSAGSILDILRFTKRAMSNDS